MVLLGELPEGIDLRVLHTCDDCLILVCCAVNDNPISWGQENLKTPP